MSSVILIRHGQKEAECGNPGLTELGKTQAAETAVFLKQFSVEKVIASPFARTQETVAPIGQLLDLPVVSDDRLRERIEWDPASLSWDSFVAEWIHATADRQYQPIIGDPSATTGKRMQEAITEHRCTEGVLVVVSHGGAIVDFLRSELGEGAVKPIAHCYTVGWDYQLWHCSITQLVYDPKPRLLLLNFSDHLLQVTE